MMNIRETALEILYKTLNDSSYANLLMRKELNSLAPINRPFVTEVVYGVLRNYQLLNYQLTGEVNNKTKLKLKLILCMAYYERHFMNTREYALVNEYVELAENRYDKAFVNALLRKNAPLKKMEGDKEEALAINYSLPLWIVKLLKKQYEYDTFTDILNVCQSKARTYYHLNHKKCGYDDLKEYQIEVIDEDFFVCSASLTGTKEFAKGFFYVQDINSAAIVKNLDLETDTTFLDMCSAPGSKLFNALETVKEENAYANDLHAHRVELIKKKAGIMGYSKVHYYNEDALNLKEKTNRTFDRILLDAPCSGLGVISRRPDIKFHIDPDSLDELEKLQSGLLDSAETMLKENGILVYSTCTVNRKENDRQIKKFLERHSNMILLKEETIIKKGGDLFYFAKLKKV